MKTTKRLTRRDVLKRAAGATVGALSVPQIVTSSALGADGGTAASERITAAFIGVGKMGKGVLGTALGHSGIQVVAVCDVWKDRREWGRSRCDERYALDRLRGSYKGCKEYGDFREILERDDIDAVMIATPPHWHAIMAIWAARAGKDVFVEKPLARTIGEARAAADTVDRLGRVLQTNSWQRSRSHFRFACEMVRSGRIGKVLEIHVNVGGPSEVCNLPAEPVPEGLDWDMWLGPAPWRPFNEILCPLNTDAEWPRWRYYRDYDGGGMTDWGAHHFDIAQWALGMDESGPVEIHPPDGVEYERLTYRYANGVTMYHGGGRKGVDIIGEKGRVMVDRDGLETEPSDLKDTPTQADEVHLYESNNHIGNWVDCIHSRAKPICNEEVACRSVTVCHLGNFAYWLNRPLKWDPVQEHFIGDEVANKMMMDSMRSPWRL